MEENQQMSLAEFISDAIRQIKIGVGDNRIKLPVSVKFEIGVVITQNQGAKTKGGLELGVASFLSLGAGGISSNNTEGKTYNNLSFTIELTQ
ncbi:MAG: hypothetical protein LBG46_06340 [Elusimicrobiota bacterium]|jgi:hypothetical protein|nr:hypothetical protein [Elusimicrobiota bacterium]